MTPDKKLPLFVVTGASCAGKTTACEILFHREKDYIVMESDILRNFFMIRRRMGTLFTATHGWNCAQTYHNAACPVYCAAAEHPNSSNRARNGPCFPTFIIWPSSVMTQPCCSVWKGAV